MNGIENRAVIVIADTSFWTGSRIDKGASDEVAVRYEAEQDSARVTKRLIDRKELKGIQNAISSAKVMHKRMTLPWDDNGGRLLPRDRMPEYKEKMAKKMADVDTETTDFVERYPELVKESSKRLGLLHKDGDFPAQETMAGKFGFRYRIQPVPSAEHFVLDLAKDEITDLKEQLETDIKKKVSEAVSSVFERLETQIRAMIERLGDDENGDPRRMGSGRIDAINELIDAIPTLNITDDKKMNRIADRLKKAMSGITFDDLRYGRTRKPADVSRIASNRKELSKKLNSIATAYFGEPSK